MRHLGCAAVAVALGACTADPGEPWARLDATLIARWADRPERAVDGAWVKLNTLYEARVTTLRLTVDRILLSSIDGAAGMAPFDPARPPPGYSLCHNGHCHAADGRIVSYADIQAEASGGRAVEQTVVSLLGSEIDLLSPNVFALPCDPRCALPATRIQRARARVTHLSIAGVVREGRTPSRLAGEWPWRWEGSIAVDGAEPVVLDTAVDLPADRHHPPRIALALMLEVDATLLDGVEWSDVAGSAAVDLGGAAARAARERVRLNLAESRLSATITRN